MRSGTSAAVALLFSSVAVPLLGAGKLTFDDRVELTRGLTAEYATVKQLLPRSKKPLAINADGTVDKKAWQEASHKNGPAARVGDLVQITKINIEDDRIELEINHGMRNGPKWYQRVEVGMGTQTAPIAQGDSNAPAGTNLVLMFNKPLSSGITSADIKKMLAPVLDFEKRSATQLYAESLPPAVQKAIKEKKVLEGMNREQVLLALGRPQHKSRETRDGMELEDWVFGTPPGKIVFVTFNGDKVVKVKEDYAGLGTEVETPKPPL